MLAEIRELAVAAAEDATAQLAALAFGAIELIRVAAVEPGVDEGVEYYIVSWSVLSLGLEQDHVRMVILAEYYDEQDGGAALAAQMAAYVVDRVLEDA